MAVRKKIIIGNWKMNPLMLSEAKGIFARIKRLALPLKKISVVICPPVLYLGELSRTIKRGNVTVGSQDVFFEELGSFTGEVSAVMVRNGGASWTIVGHSERRRLGDSDAIVAKKLSAGLKAGLFALLCVGELVRDEHGVYLAFIHEQLVGALERVPSKFLKRLVIAYEPVWAIGQKEQNAITPRHLHEMVLYVRKVLSDQYGEAVGRAVPVLYGGSVFPKNAGQFLSEGAADGLLVGRESLKPEEFGTILKIANGL